MQTMEAILLTLLGLFLLWPLGGAAAWFVFKGRFLGSRVHSTSTVVFAAIVTAIFLTPVIVIAGHNPFIVPLYLFPLFPQTGVSFLVPSVIVVGVLSSVIAGRAFRSNSSVKPDALKGDS